MEEREFKAKPARRLRLSIAWQRYRNVGVIVALVLLLLGAPLILLSVKSSYNAQAVFQVSPTYQKNMSADKDLEMQSNQQYREFVNHLSQSILRYDTLERALAALKAKDIDPRLPSEDTRKCVERLQKTIYVMAVPDTYMVRVGMRSETKKDLHEIVNAVMDSFLETTHKEQIYGADQRGQFLAERVTLLESEITEFETRRNELASFLGLTTFSESSANPYDLILRQEQERLAQVTVELKRAQATLIAFDQEKEVPAASGRSLMEMRLQDNGLQSLRNEVIKRNEELTRTIAGLQDGHPAKKQALDEMVNMKRRLHETESDFKKSALSNTRSRMVATIEQAQQVEEALSQSVNELQSQASQFASAFREAMRHTNEIKKREQELTDIRTRTNYLRTESRAFGFTRLITPALPAITPQGLGKTKSLLGLMLASMALMLLVPLLMDFLDKRVITVGDAEKAMQIPAAAWLVDKCDTATSILIDDQLRRFAATLRRNQVRGACNVYSFSSVKVGGGTTWAILQVARTLVELGSRILVVDADSLSPASVRNTNTLGLTDLMAGKANDQSVISSQNHLGIALNVVPYGLSTESGIKRIDVFKAALQTWRAQFDMVLIDLPPLLPSADAELLIDAIGQVFLVVQAEVSTKADVVRARVQLERMDPEAVGLIVNRVPLESGGDAIQTQLVETITKDRFNHFMSSPDIALRWSLLRLRLHQWWHGTE